MKCGIILHSGGSKSKSAKKNRLRKAFSGRVLWNSELGQAVVGVGAHPYEAAPVYQKKRSKVMARVRKHRDRRAMVANARKERREKKNERKRHSKTFRETK